MPTVDAAYTLLIVESQPLADRIAAFSLTGLEVIATSGWIWIPHFDQKSASLKKKAAPEKLALRKLLRNKSKWATRVIVAVDTDPTGLFNAHALARYLKHPQVQFVTLQSITPHDVYKTINSPQIKPEIPQTIDSQSLTHQLFVKAKIDAHFGELGYFKSLLILHALDNLAHTEQVDKSTDFSFGDAYKQFISRKLPSLLDMYVWAKQNEISIASCYDALQQLYHQGLITYPRTYAKACYAEEWTYWLTHPTLEVSPHLYSSILPICTSAHSAIQLVYPFLTHNEIKLKVPTIAQLVYLELHKRWEYLYSLTSTELDKQLRQEVSFTPFLATYLQNRVGLGNLHTYLVSLLNQKWLELRGGDFNIASKILDALKHIPAQERTHFSSNFSAVINDTTASTEHKEKRLTPLLSWLKKKLPNL